MSRMPRKSGCSDIRRITICLLRNATIVITRFYCIYILTFSLGASVGTPLGPWHGYSQACFSVTRHVA